MGKCEQCGQPCKDNYKLCWPCGHPETKVAEEIGGNEVVRLLKMLIAEQKKTNDLLDRHKLNVAHIRAEICKDDTLKASLRKKEE